MRIYDLGMTAIIAIVVTAAVAGYGASKFLGNDSIVEEAAEDIIYQETGIQVDLSPGQDKDLPEGSFIQLKK